MFCTYMCFMKASTNVHVHIYTHQQRHFVPGMIRKRSHLFSGSSARRVWVCTWPCWFIVSPTKWRTTQITVPFQARPYNAKNTFWNFLAVPKYLMYSAAASFLSYETAPRLFILGRERYGESTVLLCLRLANVSPFGGRGELERQVEGTCLLLPSPSRTPLRMSLVSKAAVQVAPGVCNAVVVTPVISTTTLIMTCRVCTVRQLYRPLTQLLLRCRDYTEVTECNLCNLPDCFYTNHSNLTFARKLGARTQFFVTIGHACCCWVEGSTHMGHQSPLCALLLPVLCVCIAIFSNAVEESSPDEVGSESRSTFWCPDQCTCSNSAKIVDCSGRGLTYVPKLATSTTRV